MMEMVIKTITIYILLSILQIFVSHVHVDIYVIFKFTLMPSIYVIKP